MRSVAGSSDRVVHTGACVVSGHDTAKFLSGPTALHGPKCSRAWVPMYGNAAAVASFSGAAARTCPKLPSPLTGLSYPGPHRAMETPQLRGDTRRVDTCHDGHDDGLQHGHEIGCGMFGCSGTFTLSRVGWLFVLSPAQRSGHEASVAFACRDGDRAR